jgi:TolB-like protein/DNA-binding winged helix-turn-helix (wHTH) protein/Flp pilus assembly protein TadD
MANLLKRRNLRESLAALPRRLYNVATRRKDASVPAPVNNPPLFRFGPFQLDRQACELHKGEILVHLSPQPCKVLALLASNPHKVFTRQEIQREIWGDETFVDFEQGLNAAIRQIRAALCDDAETPRYIETLPRRGYRFIAQVDGHAAAAEGARIALPTESAALSPPAVIPLSSFRRLLTQRWPLVGMGAALALLVILAALNVGGWRDRLVRRGTGIGPIQSLAVLPLQNLSGDPAQDYFADGMTEELTTDLGQISALRVISRTSAMHYKGTNKTLPEIARELHVDAVVEGSVERSGDQVRITAQLIEAPTDRHLWAKKYQRDLRDVLSLQDDVAQAIANEVKIKLTPQEQIQLAKARPVKPEAHEAYLRGLYELRKQTGEGVEKAVEYFRQAVALDPNEALAYASLAAAYYEQSSILRAPLEVMPKAKAAAARAIELDDALAEAHASLGYVKLNFDWDWPGAEREFRRSLELNPNLPLAHAGYAHYLLTVRRSEEATQEVVRAQTIDPLVPVSKFSLQYLLFNARRYGEAIEAGRQVGDDRILALSFAELGRSEQAVAAADRAVKSARSPVFLAQIASAYAMAGKKDTARTMLSTIEAQARQRYICGFNVACVYATLGDNERAFAWLENAYLARSD